MNGPISQQKGFILPTLTSVTVILLMLATILLTSGTASLRSATHDQQSDQALFAAEAGLVRATAEYAKSGSLTNPYEGTLSSGAKYVVTITENKAGVETHVPNGPEIPGKTVYFLSRGYSENGTYRETAALFQYGLEAFKVGALGDQVDLTDSTFDAYDSSKGDYDPNVTENQLPLLATNTGTGEPVTLTNSNVKGDLFVGPSGSDAQVQKDTASTRGDVHTLDTPIAIDAIEVPEDPDDDGTGSGYWNVPDMGNLKLINADSGGYHFSDGTISFTIQPGPPTTNIQEAMNRIQITSPNTYFTQGGAGSNYLVIYSNYTSGGVFRPTQIEVQTSGYSQYVSGGSPVSDNTAQSIANLLFNYDGGGPASNDDLVNPDTIEPGHYDSITLNDGGTRGRLAESGVYVVKSLNISPGNSLALEDPNLDVTIYVTESMSVDGKDTIVNASQRAPKMKIFYTGTNDVNLQGGSQSYYSLVAPEAKVSLRSLDAPTHFYGALVGNTVNVTNAMFHFDVDTKGIGTGTRGTGILLLNRHRL